MTFLMIKNEKRPNLYKKVRFGRFSLCADIDDRPFNTKSDCAELMPENYVALLQCENPYAGKQAVVFSL